MDMNMMKMMEQFGNDEKCRTALEGLRWPKGPVCPKCKSKSFSQVKKRGVYDCNSCRHQFSVLAGTIFWVGGIVTKDRIVSSGNVYIIVLCREV